MKNPKIEYGGTGFYYDSAPKLPDKIEHIKPDYHLYDAWIETCIEKGAKEREFIYYKDYSIGFTTRGCFRQCQFCVNKHYKKCIAHSQLSEFIDYDRPKICLLDDNFFACPQWEQIIQQIKDTGKKFQFKQGLDERLLTEHKIHELMSWNYDGRFIFAFDNVDDAELIESKMQKVEELYPNFSAGFVFYVFCGYDRNNKYDETFYKQDIENLFKRLFILAKYNHIPYVMRHENIYKTEYSGLYSVIAAWANQAAFFRKKSFAEFSKIRGISNKVYQKYKDNVDQYLKDGYAKGASWRYLDSITEKYPEIANKYFDTVPEQIYLKRKKL